jgi:hypothetical protein
VPHLLERDGGGRLACVHHPIEAAVAPARQFEAA